MGGALASITEGTERIFGEIRGEIQDPGSRMQDSGFRMHPAIRIQRRGFEPRGS